MKLSETEKIAKQILEEAGWIVVKPNWPDFLIYTPTNPPSYCFVEVKKNVYEHISEDQLKTLHLLKTLGFPCLLFYTDEKTFSLRNLRKASKRMTLKEKL